MFKYFYLKFAFRFSGRYYFCRCLLPKFNNSFIFYALHLMEPPNFKLFVKVISDMTHFDILIFQFPFGIPAKNSSLMTVTFSY